MIAFIAKYYIIKRTSATRYENQKWRIMFFEYRQFASWNDDFF